MLHHTDGSKFQIHRHNSLTTLIILIQDYSTLDQGRENTTLMFTWKETMGEPDLELSFTDHNKAKEPLS